MEKEKFLYERKRELVRHSEIYEEKIEYYKKLLDKVKLEAQLLGIKLEDE